jgi:hypothetical protein
VLLSLRDFCCKRGKRRSRNIFEISEEKNKRREKRSVVERFEEKARK